jgi:membrane associated rhomboid family serine protease
MDKWLLDIEMIKSNRMYMYQTATAIFMHNNYVHILGNMIFALFVMYEMENSWKWSIPMGLLAGWAANCLAVLTIEGRALGFSGVLTSYVGMIVLLLVSHLAYFEARTRGAYCWLLVMAVFLTVAAIGFGGSVLVHLYGFVFGIVLAAAFYPKHP